MSLFSSSLPKVGIASGPGRRSVASALVALPLWTSATATRSASFCSLKIKDVAAGNQTVADEADPDALVAAPHTPPTGSGKNEWQHPCTNVRPSVSASAKVRRMFTWGVGTGATVSSGLMSRLREPPWNCIPSAKGRPAARGVTGATPVAALLSPGDARGSIVRGFGRPRVVSKVRTLPGPHGNEFLSTGLLCRAGDVPHEEVLQRIEQLQCVSKPGSGIWLASTNRSDS